MTARREKRVQRVRTIGRGDGDMHASGLNDCPLLYVNNVFGTILVSKRIGDAAV